MPSCRRCRQLRFLQAFRKTHPGTGGDKPRPYERSGSVSVGAAISRPRVDEDIDPYKFPSHPVGAAISRPRVDGDIDPYRAHRKSAPHP